MAGLGPWEALLILIPGGNTNMEYKIQNIFSDYKYKILKIFQILNTGKTQLLLD